MILKKVAQSLTDKDVMDLLSRPTSQEAIR